MRALTLGLLTLLIAGSGVLFATTDRFRDRLEVPVSVTKLTTSTQLTAITRAGERLLAVGVRGLIVYSDDHGKTWKQAAVPLSSDLLDVHFPTPTDGWAVGHDGVVLHSGDGGITWQKQFDGIQAEKLLTAHFKKLASGGNADAERFLRDTALNYKEGPEQSLLGVWFDDARHGFVAGSFGTIFSTSNGGKSWESWVENVDSEMPLHYNAIRGFKGDVFIASEKGLVFRLDRAKRRFMAVPTGYSGSFFGLVVHRDALLAVGLRGSAFRTVNGGRDWKELKTGISSTITSGASNGNGKLVLVAQTGQVILSEDEGAHFRSLSVPRAMGNTGVSWATPRTVIVIGDRGIQEVPLN